MFAHKKRNRDGEAPKPCAVSVAFGVFAEVHFHPEDIKVWSSQKADESEHGFKLGLGDTFFQGLNILAARNTYIGELEESKSNLKTEASSATTMAKNLQKKYDDEDRANQNLSKVVE